MSRGEPGGSDHRTPPRLAGAAPAATPPLAPGGAYDAGVRAVAMALVALVLAGAFVGILLPLRDAFAGVSWSLPALEGGAARTPTAAPAVSPTPTVAWLVYPTARVVEVQVTVEVPVTVVVPVPVTVTPAPHAAGGSFAPTRTVRAVPSPTPSRVPAGATRATPTPRNPARGRD